MFTQIVTLLSAPTHTYLCVCVSVRFIYANVHTDTEICIHAHSCVCAYTRVYTLHLASSVPGNREPPGHSLGPAAPQLAGVGVQVALRGWLSLASLASSVGTGTSGAPRTAPPPRGRLLPPGTRLAWNLTPCFLLYPDPSRVFQ